MLQNIIVDLNSFEIIDLVVEGPSGKTYLVEEKRTGKCYSAKILNKSLSSPTLQKNLMTKWFSIHKFNIMLYYHYIELIIMISIIHYR